MKPVSSIDEAQKLIASYVGRPEEFQLPISDELQHPVGMNMAILADTILKRGWEPDGYSVRPNENVKRLSIAASCIVKA